MLVTTIRDRACELMALVMADEPLMKLAGKQHFEGVITHYSSYRDERILELLVLLAASYRQHSWNIPKEKEGKPWPVGTLYVEEKEGIDLSMHEACNKIIHTEEYSFETRKIRNIPLEYIDDTVLLSGKRNKEEWLACVWIPEFCDQFLSVRSTIDELLNT